MTSAVETAGLISYEEAAGILGKNVQAVRGAVSRALFRTIPDPSDARRRLLSRAEVEAYKAKTDRRNATPPPGSGGLLTYEEAGKMLGKGDIALRSLVHRGHLHSYPDPSDARRRLLSRAEVEAYAVKVYQRGMPVSVPASKSSPLSGIGIDASPQLLGAIAGGIALIVLLVFLLKEAPDPALQTIIVAAVAGVVLLVLKEWEEQGRISAQERERVERLARESETHPDAFMDEVERLFVEGA